MLDVRTWRSRVRLVHASNFCLPPSLRGMVHPDLSYPVAGAESGIGGVRASLLMPYFRPVIEQARKTSTTLPRLRPDGS